jgi:hypothetical protein
MVNAPSRWDELRDAGPAGRRRYFGRIAGGAPALPEPTLRDLAGVRVRYIDFFLLFERNGQNQQQADQSEGAECNQSKHQDGHCSLLNCIVKQCEHEVGDGGHWAL